MKKYTKKIYTVAIGIPAYNEAGNIKRLLKSLISQKIPKEFSLESINILSDGSTDNTVIKVNSIKDERIKLYNYSERFGKNTRLNQLFKNSKSDILVLFDADTLISDKYVIASLINKFLQNRNIGLVAGNAQPLPAVTLVEKAINNFVYSLNFMKSKINKGNNIYSVRGPIIALSKEYYKRVSLPLNVPDDRFLYLKSIQYGFDFRYSNEALVFYRSPQTLADQKNQGLRFLKDKENLSKHFKQEFIDGEYYIPFYLKLSMLILQLLRNPIAYLTMKFIHLQILKSTTQQLNHKWQIVQSSKKLI